MGRHLDKNAFRKKRMKNALRKLKISNNNAALGRMINYTRTQVSNTLNSGFISSEMLDKIAKLTDVNPDYLLGKYNNRIPKKSPLYEFYSERGRLDPEGYDMGTYESYARIAGMNERLQVLAEYMRLLGVRGIDGWAFDDGKMRYFTQDDIMPCINDLFEKKIIAAIASILKENGFFTDGEELLPKVKESED